MRVIFAVLYIVAFLFNTSEASNKKIEWSVAPIISKNFGQSEYEMDLSFLDTVANSVVPQRVRSLLEFPMDFVMGGMQVELRSVPTLKDYWGIEATFQTNLGDPGKHMIDSDWHTISGFFEETMFSFTRSDAQATVIQLQLQAYRRLFGTQKLSVALMAGFQYYKIDQDVIGYDGWQRQFDSANARYLDPIPISGTDPAILYNVTYKSPQIGLMTRLELADDNRIELKSAFMPVFASDTDDHVLRNKLSTAEGTGVGFLSELKIHLVPGSKQRKNRLFFDLVSKFFTLKVSSNQIQHWYDDETATNRASQTRVVVKKGTLIAGVPHEIRSTQYDLGVRLGILF